MNTELLQHIELLVGSIGVILGLFFASFLLANRSKQPRANLFLSIYLWAFSLRIGKSLFHNYFEVNATLRTLFLTVLLCVGPSIWLYTLYLLNPKAKPKVKDYLHFLLFLVMASICWLIPNDGAPIFGVFYDFLTVHMFAYTAFSLVWLSRQKKAWNIQEGERVKRWLSYFLSINLVMIVVYFLISKSIIPFYLGLSFLFSIVVISLSFFALKHPFLFKNSIEKYKQSGFDNQDAIQLMKTLKNLMEQKKPYLDPGLNLSGLSKKLGVSTKALSQAINQVEALNYSQYVSKYRVQEVQQLMRSPAYSNMTIAAIAYDCGFNSISTFNAAFKKYAGETAIQYRNSLKVY